MSTDVSNVFGNQMKLGRIPDKRSNILRSGATNFLGVSVPILPCSDSQYALNSAIDQTKPIDQHRADVHGRIDATGSVFDEFPFSQNPNVDPAPGSVLHTWPPGLTATNAIPSPQDTNTVVPLQTCLDHDLSFMFDQSFSTNSPVSLASTIESKNRHVADGEKSAAKPAVERRCDSLKTSNDTKALITATPPATGRRMLENVERGSQRALYLEKNRKAASKCRSKQKKQQEELVEAARDMEHKNKALKAEVESLKSEMRELMALIWQHTDCSDTRLRTYVQREADRLATGGTTTPIFGFYLSKKSVSPGEGIEQ